MADIDECARDTDGCERSCNNTVGSFICSCNTGYILTMDGKNCTGKYNVYLKHTHDTYVNERNCNAVLKVMVLMRGYVVDR